MQTITIRIDSLTESERTAINILTTAERKQALLRAAEEKAKEIFNTSTRS